MKHRCCYLEAIPTQNRTSKVFFPISGPHGTHCWPKNNSNNRTQEHVFPVLCITLRTCKICDWTKIIERHKSKSNRVINQNNHKHQHEPSIRKESIDKRSTKNLSNSLVLKILNNISSNSSGGVVQWWMCSIASEC